MTASEAVSCNAAQLMSSAPWIFAIIVGVFVWSRRELRFASERSAAQQQYLDEMVKLTEKYAKDLAALRESNAAELQLIRESKNLVWLHVSEKGDAYVCPGCGMEQKQRRAAH